MEEIWKDVIDYEGLYQVSDLGNVKSLRRMDRNNHPVRERILKKTFDGNYLRVNLSKEGKATLIGIHVLVASAFLGHKPNKWVLVVNHKDFDRFNNNKNNLEIVTQRENANQKHMKSSSKYTGVSWMKNSNKWVSIIVVNRKNKYLGMFENEYEAHLAYEKALEEVLNKNKIKP